MMILFGCPAFLLLHVLACLGQNALGDEIVDGTRASNTSDLFMASVQNRGRHMCGGFLIREDVVLTAAHCHSRREPITNVVLGAHDLKKGKAISVAKVCPHPLFKSVGHGNDILLLKLAKKVQLGKTLQQVKIPSTQLTLANNEICHVSGWGATKTNGYNVDQLRDVDVSVIDPTVCLNQWGGKLPANIICAGGYKTTKGFCQGDSGGPLVCRDMAVGIVSFNSFCDYPHLPNVYTDVSRFLPWIEETLKKKDC